MESTNNNHLNPKKDLTFKDLQNLKLKIFDHPHLKDTCFIMGMQQREQLKTCGVFQAFIGNIKVNENLNENISDELNLDSYETQVQNSLNQMKNKNTFNSDDDFQNFQIKGAGEPEFSSD